LFGTVVLATDHTPKQQEVNLTSRRIRIIDLTARFGSYVLKQLGHQLPESVDAILVEDLFLEKKRIGALLVDWMGIGSNASELTKLLQKPSISTLVLVGPGAYSSLSAATEAIQASASKCLYLVAPNALMEESFLKQCAQKSGKDLQIVRLPSSDPQTVWFFLMDQVDKIAAKNKAKISTTESSNPMSSNLKECIDAAMSIDGAIAVALVDFRSGMCLAKGGGGNIDLDLAAAGNTEVVRAKLKTIDSLKLKKGIEDILITLVDQYHLIRLVPNNQGLFLYLVLDKVRGNLALARYKLTDIERLLKV
jgi:hypothetical protein